METHITNTRGSAFFYPYSIRHTRKYLISECTKKLIHAFIISRLDYCNSLLYGVPDHHVQKLLRVMNVSARLIFCTPRHCHITPFLQQLSTISWYLDFYSIVFVFFLSIVIVNRFFSVSNLLSSLQSAFDYSYRKCAI